MKYTCLKCNKIFNKKSNYQKHLDRKRPCVKTNSNNLDKNITDIFKLSNKQEITEKQQVVTGKQQFLTDKNNICKYCDKNFTRKYGLIQHYKICKLKKIIDEENNNKDKLIELLLEEKENNKKHNEELRNKINELEQIILKSQNRRSNIISNNNNNNNSNNNITNNIVVKFGNEDINKLTFDEKLKICSSSFSATKNYITSLYFNERIPEHHNIYVSDKKFKHALVYDGNTNACLNSTFRINDR